MSSGYKSLYAGALEFRLADLTLLSIGLTIWWFTTMLPFILTITPPLIRVAAETFPSIVPEQVRRHRAEVTCYTTQAAIDYGVRSYVMEWATGRPPVLKLTG